MVADAGASRAGVQVVAVGPIEITFRFPSVKIGPLKAGGPLELSPPFALLATVLEQTTTTHIFWFADLHLCLFHCLFLQVKNI